MTITPDEFDQLKTLITVVVEESVVKVIDRKFDEKLGNLPTKDEFYTETLRILTKIEDLETEMSIQSNHSSDHSDRLEKLEKIHPSYKHAAL